MPLSPTSDYRPPPGLAGGHRQTLYAYFVRRVDGPPLARERLPTPDGDFVDLDWAKVGGRAAAVLLHGLEGNARRPYMRGMMRAFNRRGWDAVGVNFRGCSGAPNLGPRTYHGGSTDDLAHVLAHVEASGRYARLALVGFSLGGNIVLKYLGEPRTDRPTALSHAVTFSVPTDFGAGARHMDRPSNRLYRMNFLRALNAKALRKHARFPECLAPPPRPLPRTLTAFDDWYTAPVHGFRDAADYYASVSARCFLPAIRIPTLIVNARNDPFLPEACYPYREAKTSAWVTLETPTSGGHVGFVSFGRDGEFWSEARACAFVTRDG